MRTSLLWFDNRDVSLAERIEPAVQRAREKYGYEGTPVCYMNDPEVDTVSTKFGDLPVKHNNGILPNHLAICLEEPCPRCGTRVEGIIWGQTHCPKCDLKFSYCE